MSRPGIEEVLPLAPLQEGFLFHALRDEDRDPYVAQRVLRLDGRLDAGLLRASAGALLRRHPNLRAGFQVLRSGRPVQVVPRDFTLPWSELVLEDLSGDEQRRAVDRAAGRERSRGFDVAAPPLLRCALLRLGPERHVLVLTFHHILLDGWSAHLLTGELLTVYRRGGDATALPAVPPYREHLAWLAAQDPAAAREAWRSALDGLDGPTHVAPPAALDRPVPPEAVQVTLAPELVAALDAAARRHGLTRHTITQGAWAILLARLTGRTDVVFCGVVSGLPP